MKQYKIIVERHPDGYVAYPLGIRGVKGDISDKHDSYLANYEIKRKR